MQPLEHTEQTTSAFRIELSAHLYGQSSGWVYQGDKRVGLITLPSTIGYELERMVRAHNELFFAVQTMAECEHVHDLPIESCLDVPEIEDNEQAACARCQVLLRADWKRAVGFHV